jgi:hypothetical protein
VELSDVIIESIANQAKMDGIVTSVLRTGFFVDCGSLQAFVGRSVNPILLACAHSSLTATDDSC